MAMGRPKTQIDQKHFEALCAMMCTKEEISDFFDCSDDTISRWCKREYKETFADAYKRLSAPGKVSLRRLIMRRAETQNAVLIFAAKNYLGMRDVVENAVDMNVNVVHDYGDTGTE